MNFKINLRIMCKSHFKQESRCTHPRFITVWGTLTFSVKIKAQNDKLTAKKTTTTQNNSIQPLYSSPLFVNHLLHRNPEILTIRQCNSTKVLSLMTLHILSHIIMIHTADNIERIPSTSTSQSVETDPASLAATQR